VENDWGERKRRMKTTIYYYTGTGNSLWVARRLSQELGDASLVSIPDLKEGEGISHSEVVGLIFPVYIWGVPAPIVRFAARLEGLRPRYFFAVAVNGGQVANTLIELKGILKSIGINLASGFEVETPSNYIPWGGPGPREKQNERFGKARIKITRIAERVRNGVEGPMEKGPLWQRALFTFFHKLSFNQVRRMDRKFWVDEKCNECGICARVCPASNITMSAGKPSWSHRCEQCLACIQWCPKEAIQYGKKTSKYERYHHPEVSLKDVLKSPRHQGREGDKG
jgi:formate hydrogenlyase subunit 6/NADH:ubiquinone oxidoreductase subunit I